MNAAEIFVETIKPGGRPERQLKQYEALGFVGNDPINLYLREGQGPGLEGEDKWGVYIKFPEDAPGKTPYITEENKVLKDITRWREYVHVPDIETAALGDWEAPREKAREIREEGRLATVLMGTGIFEQVHFLMGFEDALTALYEHPEEMHELIECITEYRIRYVSHICEKLHPDVILSHDDWGTKTGLFMQPDIWREFFKEPYRRFYEVIRSHDIIAIHHADSYLVPIVPDMVELGIQVWQGVLPENNVPKLLRELDGRMALMGGIGAAIDREDVEEEEAREYIRGVLESCCRYSCFIPCITYGGPGTVYKKVDGFINDEIDRYNNRLHIRFDLGRATEEADLASRAKELSADESSPAEAADGRLAGSDEAEADTRSDASDILRELSEAVENGQAGRAERILKSEAAEAIDPHTILDEALITAMNRVGDDFTAGEVFVPEMLLAAKAMKAALDILRPRLVSESKEPLGRACIGTVQGDLHDIGKNLVRVMLEGSGIEVIDLGTDVSAERFVETAREEACDIICCSSLLTTTVGEMRNVVDACRVAGIRDDVIIMVGGAPVTQGFCDDIGADIYSEDAGSAARKAVSALKSRKDK